jgi:glycosyltransferase involved in cell wall biosynthesis
MKLACVVHRFGADIAGGSEGHCRVIAERLAINHDVTILTTTAKDHVTWRNAYPAGTSSIGPLTVRRFRVARQRSMRDFAEISDIVFSGGAPQAVQEQWFRANGPEAPGLLTHLEHHGRDFDLILFWSFRYYQSFFGVPIVAERAVLVPTAEDDPAIGLDVLCRYFTRPAGLVFLTPEEQKLVEHHADGSLGPSCVIGSGVEAPVAHRHVDLERLGVTPPYVLYLGRIDPNKGCETLIRSFTRWADGTNAGVSLVMAGPANMPIPAHDRVKMLGFVDHDVREALLAQATLLVVPSPFESLSMVLLEAWNHAVPALVNGRCRVLKGQAQRSGGALYYQNYFEFAGALEVLLGRPELARDLGRSGRDYVDLVYRWPHVMNTLEAFLVALVRSPAAAAESAEARVTVATS